MDEVTLDFEAPAEVLQAILAEAEKIEAEHSEAVSCESTAEPLHSPLTGAEIHVVLETAVVVFKTVAAASSFIGAVFKMLEAYERYGTARVKNRQTGKVLVLKRNEPPRETTIF